MSALNLCRLFACCLLLQQICACPTVYSPICGRDGKTYSNKCFKPKHVLEACKGECPCKSPRSAGLPRCTYNYVPVCGTDGQTYSNHCEIEQEILSNPCLEVACHNACPCNFPVRKRFC